MVQPPQRPPLAKIVRDKYKGLFILCKDGFYVGMYPASLSDIIEASPQKTKTIIDILELLVDDLELYQLERITQTVLSLNNLVSDPPESDKFNAILKKMKEKQHLSLVTIQDVAEILETSFEFAQELYDSYDNVIETESDLEKFLKHVDYYLDKNYDGKIPEEHKQKKHQDLNNKNKSHFDKKRIQEILRQEAPTELRAESFIQPLKQEEFDIQETDQQENSLNNNTNPNNDDITNSPHFEKTVKTIQELLNIDEEEAKLILSTPQSLAEFLDIDDTEFTRQILDDVANGDMTSLAGVLDKRVEELTQEFANEDKPTQNADSQQEKNVIQTPVTTDKTDNTITAQEKNFSADATKNLPEKPAPIINKEKESSFAPHSSQENNVFGQPSDNDAVANNEINTNGSISNSLPNTDLNSETDGRKSSQDLFGFYSQKNQDSIHSQNNADNLFEPEFSYKDKQQTTAYEQLTNISSPNQQQEISDKPPQSIIPPPPQISQQPHSQPSNTSSGVVADSSNKELQNNQTQRQPQEKHRRESLLSKSKKIPDDIKLPDTLTETLYLAFDMKQRITAKSLSQSYELFDVPISQSLARFIIEEGGYGGLAPNNHRIMNKRMVEKMIADIDACGGLRPYVKKYLEKINNDLKSMLSGG